MLAWGSNTDVISVPVYVYYSYVIKIFLNF